MKPHLYINSKGYFVTRHSYSGSQSFNECARKYYLERVQGWAEKTQRSSTFFGTALEKAITFYHQRGMDVSASVAEFVRLWAEHKDKPYTYTKSDLDWDRLNLTGQEMVKLYALRYPTFPYVVNNPHDFQVETTFEMFPGSEKMAGIEFTSYIDLIAQKKDGGAPLIIDIKTSGKDVPADLIVMDPQLRSYSWVKGWADVAFLWFRKMGRSISKGDSATILEAYAGFAPADEVTVLATDDFGLWVVADNEAGNQVIEGMKQFVGESKAVKAARQAYVEANSKHVLETALTKQRVQFAMGSISQDSADDIGRSIKRDIVGIVAANQNEDWHMNSGIRFPKEQCTFCPMRGICADKPELRDMILMRKQKDELDFTIEIE